MKRYLPYIIILVLLFILAGLYIDQTSNMKFISVGTSQKSDETKTELDNYGPAPELTGITNWLNTDAPVKIKDLKGKVVLIDFWTYSCINCIRTLPYITKWYDTYKDQGLVVIGVHTPEFTPEYVTENVQRAIGQYKIHYPVAQDNDYRTWKIYNNHYWPAKYLIDKNGDLVYTHFGEGEYEETEKVIQQLLGVSAPVVSEEQEQKARYAQTPEIYFGTKRQEYLSSEQANLLSKNLTNSFSSPQDLPLHNFAVEGKWSFDQEKATLVSSTGKIKLHFLAGKVFMVASSKSPQTIKATVEGNTKTVSVKEPTLYTLYEGTYGEHTLEITINHEDFEAYSFTFGQ